MASWLAVVIGLFVLGLAAPATGALRAWRHARATLRRIEWEQRRSVELEDEWKAARDAVGAEFEADTRRRQDETVPAYEARLREQLDLGERHIAIVQGRIAAFAAEGLIAPTNGNLADLPGMEARRVLRAVLDGNLSNLLLVLAGPLLSTAASILALFPAWHLA